MLQFTLLNQLFLFYIKPFLSPLDLAFSFVNLILYMHFLNLEFNTTKFDHIILLELVDLLWDLLMVDLEKPKDIIHSLLHVYWWKSWLSELQVIFIHVNVDVIWLYPFYIILIPFLVYLQKFLMRCTVLILNIAIKVIEKYSLTISYHNLASIDD